MGKVAENRVPLKFYIDKDLKEEFKKYSSDSICLKSWITL